MMRPAPALLLVAATCVMLLVICVESGHQTQKPKLPNHRQMSPAQKIRYRMKEMGYIDFVDASQFAMNDAAVEGVQMQQHSFDELNLHDSYQMERKALLDIYNATGGDQWTVKWPVNVVDDHCQWYGVNCTANGYVSILLFQENGLRGTLPSSMGAFQEMEGLYIIGNRRLTGSIPSTLGNLQNLKVLELSWNSLIGTIPTELAQLSSLEVLDLSFNIINGTIPTELAQLNKMLSFILWTNSITGTIPPQLSNFTKLITLDVGSNMLSGTMPESLLNSYTQIKMFFFDTNMIGGTLPQDVGAKMPLVELFYADSNHFQGQLPTGFGALMNLNQLFLGNNWFTGTVPSEWESLKNARDFIALDISLNMLTGSIPTFISSLRNLTVLRLNDNGFSSISKDFFQLDNVVTLALQNNPLMLDFIPATPPTGFIVQLDISNTGLTTDIRKLPGGEQAAPIMRLSNNQNLVGSIDTLPLGLDQGVIFTELYVSNTSIHGIIPNMNSYGYRHLQVLDVSLNPGISGPLPIQWLRTSSTLTLNVTGLKLIRDDEDLQFSQDTHVFEDLGYMCHRLAWPSPNVEVVGLDAAYFGYERCTCLRGYKGHPPHCQLSPDSTNKGLIIGLSIFVAILLSAVIVLVRRRVRKWFVLRRELRNAEELLSQYADLIPRSFKNRNGTTVNGWKGGNDLSSALLQSCSGGMDDIPIDIPLLADAVNSLSQDWIIDYDDVIQVHAVASGSTAEVSLGLWRHAYVAVKRFHTSAMSYDDRKRFTAESALHVQLRHPNIVQLLGVCVDPLCTVTEWMERGSLFSVLQKNPQWLLLNTHSHSATSGGAVATISDVIPKKRSPVANVNQQQVGDVAIDKPVVSELGAEPMTIADVEPAEQSANPIVVWLRSVPKTQRSEAVVRIALDVARGMSYLHSKGVLHRDLKSLNVLLNSAGVAKVADFGHARVASEKTMTVAQGTAAWMAPEVFESGYYSTKCDVYSYGIVLYELCTMEVPFDNLRFSHQVQTAVINGERPQLRGLKYYFCDDPQILDLVERCWDPDPHKRPSFDEIVDLLEEKANVVGW